MQFIKPWLAIVLVGVTLAAAIWLAPSFVDAKEKRMVVEYIRYEVPAARHEEFRAAYAAAASDLDASPQCLAYEVSQGIEEPDNFIVRIEWQSVDEHMQDFRNSPQFRSFFLKVKPFFSEIREMKHYQVTTRSKAR